MNIVDVLWVDAGLKMGWQNVEEVIAYVENDDNFLVHSVGYLFGEDDEMITIVQGYTTGDNVLNPVRIRKVNILKIEELNHEPQAESD